MCRKGDRAINVARHQVVLAVIDGATIPAVRHVGSTNATESHLQRHGSRCRRIHDQARLEKREQNNGKDAASADHAIFLRRPIENEKMQDVTSSGRGSPGAEAGHRSRSRKTPGSGGPDSGSGAAPTQYPLDRVRAGANTEPSRVTGTLSLTQSSRGRSWAGDGFWDGSPAMAAAMPSPGGIPPADPPLRRHQIRVAQTH